MKLTGNTILITGGGSGIGRALAEQLHQRGNKIIIAGRRKERLAKTIEANPGLKSIELDVASRESIQDAAASLIANYPNLNVVINSAGIMQIDNAGAAIDDELIVSTINSNLVGTIRLTGALIEHLKKQEASTMVAISSVLRFTPMAMTTVHSASKAAIHSYAQSLRFKLRNTSVQVLGVIPSWVRTKLLNSTEEARAIPLDEFIEGTMRVLATDAKEIMVPRAECLRGQAGANEAAFVHSFNEGLEAPAD